MSKSQKEQILHHLQTHGSITPITALDKIGCFRLAARVHELREEGHNITVRDDDNDYATYELIRPGQGDMFGEPEARYQDARTL